jgi:8-oxo-dGTP pyrophosphatase MutT (NUDIX family)
MGFDSSAKHLRASRLPEKLLKGFSKQRQQVAAVCYRMGKRDIEFLLVQTRGGRWIFPKGGVKSGLTRAQSAALEAFEEAGVHGRMEKIPFARYFRRTAGSSATGSSEAELAIGAHLCEVARLEPPQEANRNPTWFSAERAKQRLLKNRAPEFGAELARVIDRALSRIQRLHERAQRTSDHTRRDGLQEVRLEAFEYGRLPGNLREAGLARYLLHRREARSSAAIAVAVQAHLRNAQPVEAPEEMIRPILRLGAGATSPANPATNITAIDRGQRAISSSRVKPGSSKP